jgi:DNA-binding LacI/PurR family transcriptional regulator
VHIPHDALGVEAARLLLERMQHADAPAQEVRLAPTLVARGSTARALI